MLTVSSWCMSRTHAHELISSAWSSPMRFAPPSVAPKCAACVTLPASCAALRHAVPRCATLCHAVPRCAVLCCAVLHPTAPNCTACRCVPRAGSMGWKPPTLSTPTPTRACSPTLTGGCCGCWARWAHAVRALGPCWACLGPCWACFALVGPLLGALCSLLLLCDPLGPRCLASFSCLPFPC